MSSSSPSCRFVSVECGAQEQEGDAGDGGDVQPSADTLVSCLHKSTWRGCKEGKYVVIYFKF